MNSSLTNVCRLCLEISDDSVNIFDKFEHSTIAVILNKHFWFEVHKNDGLSELLCQLCWIQIKTFHIFYQRIEFRQNHGKLHDFVNVIKQEESACTRDEIPEADLNLVKLEEAEQTFESINDKNDGSDDCDDDVDDDDDDDDHSDDKNWQASEDDDDDDDDYTSNENSKADKASNVAGTVRPSNAKTKRKTFSSLSKSEQREEIARLHEFFNMKCDICSDGVEFETLTMVKAHYRKVHNMSGYLVCCNKKMWKRYVILDHIRYHMNPEAFGCDQCKKTFQSKGQLDLHMVVHTPMELRPHKCTECTGRFTTAYHLKVHLRNKHSDADKSFACDKCHKKFRTKSSLVIHIRGVHDATCQCVCEICAKRFKTKEALRGHIANQHSATPLPVAQCHLCGAWLKHKLGLKGHLKRHHEAEQEGDTNEIKCTFTNCDKMFRNKTLLGGHIKSVHGERSHQCVQCEKAFKNAKMLKEHIALHTGEYLYNCMYCDRKFKSNANMYSHRKKAHVVEWKRDKAEKKIR